MTDDSPSLDELDIVGEAEVSPAQLRVDGENPNEQGDTTFGRLIEGLRSGWVGGPIVVNVGDLPGYDGDSDHLICDGEHRWRAAQEANRETVPVKRVDFDDDAQRRYWRQHLNKVTGDHDAKRDALEYDELLSSGYTEEVEALTDAADEDLDELLAELRVDDNVGPAYEYDPDHNVYFEDCVEGMRERLDDDSVDMVFTSPPYNIDKEQSGTRDSDAVEYEDSKTDKEFRQFLSDVFKELARVVKPSGHIFINLDNDCTDGICDPSTWVCGLMPTELRSMIVWSKMSFHRPHYPDRGQYQTDWEPIYHFSSDPSPIGEKKASSVWEIPTAERIDGLDYGEHPAPFPTTLVEKAVKQISAEGDTILDPFMGSGTTAVAAIQNDRDYVGFELDEEGAYKPIIERRIGEAKRQREAGVNDDNE